MIDSIHIAAGLGLTQDWGVVIADVNKRTAMNETLVAASTRERVQEAIDALGFAVYLFYRPGPRVGELRAGQQRIGIDGRGDLADFHWNVSLLASARKRNCRSTA